MSIKNDWRLAVDWFKHGDTDLIDISKPEKKFPISDEWCFYILAAAAAWFFVGFWYFFIVVAVFSLSCIAEDNRKYERRQRDAIQDELMQIRRQLERNSSC